MKKRFIGILAGAVLAASLIAGCATRGRGELVWHESHDVIIIGAGISGYVTYLSIMQAAQDSGRDLNVLFIEQMGISGGITRLAGGANFNNMRYWHGLSRTEIETRYGLWMSGAAGVAEPVTPAPHLVLNILNPARPYPDFDLLYPIMGSIRDAWVFLYTQFGGNPPAAGAVPSQNLATRVLEFAGAGGGPGYMTAFGMAGTALGGTNHLRLNHRAVELHQAQNAAGEYVGVGITLIDNQNRRRNHQGSVIVFATGGFAQNPAMKEEFSRASGDWPETGLNNFLLHAPHFVGADGSGINILRHGALPRPAAIYTSGFGVITGGRPHIDLSAVNAARTYPPPAFDAIAMFGGGAISSPLLDLFGSVLVNGDGVRTLNEYSLSAWNAKGSHHMHTENIFPYWRVFSSHTGNAGDGLAAREAGVSALLEAVNFIGGTAGTQAQRQRVAHELVSADTLEALALAMFNTNNVNHPSVVAFLSTMAAYDAWVAGNTGTDPHAASFFPAGFGKTLPQAAGVRFNDGAGPFFAVRWYPSGWDTAGGVRSNSNAQVIDIYGNAISNVFAVGGVSNRFYFGETYVGGSSLTFYPAIARRATAQIIRELGW